MPVFDTRSMEFISRSADQTRRLGMRLGSFLMPGDVICMTGELGSGKTTLVQGVASGWGSLDLATSPTFVLVNVYRHPEGGSLFHLDAYRLNDPREAEDLDLDAMIESGPLLVEWAERIIEVLPPEHILIKFHIVGDEQRDMIFTAQGLRNQELILALRAKIFGVA